MLIKYVAFTGLCAVTGLAYIEYFKRVRINKEIQDLMEKKQLSTYLYDLAQQSSYSIDMVMDNFQRGYNQISINKYRDALVKQCSGKVLQTCAGSNRNLKFYTPGIDLTLIDYSPSMVGVGSSKIVPSLNYKYLLGDVMKMPFKDNTFDSVIDTFGLEYVLNPSQAFSEIRRVCKKDGKIILLNEGLSNIVELHFLQNLKWGSNLLKGGYFSNRNWQKLVKQFDFEIVHQERKKNGKLYIYILKNVKKQASAN